MTDLDGSRSGSDEKNYRIVIVEPSGLECLLISTKIRSEKRCETNLKAAAAMSVQVGSFADPQCTG